MSSVGTKRKARTKRNSLPVCRATVDTPPPLDERCGRTSRRASQRLNGVEISDTLRIRLEHCLCRLPLDVGRCAKKGLSVPVWRGAVDTRTYTDWLRKATDILRLRNSNFDMTTRYQEQQARPPKQNQRSNDLHSPPQCSSPP